MQDKHDGLMISRSAFPFEMILELKDMSHEPEIFCGSNRGTKGEKISRKR